MGNCCSSSGNHHKRRKLKKASSPLLKTAAANPNPFNPPSCVLMGAPQSLDAEVPSVIETHNTMKNIPQYRNLLIEIEMFSEQFNKSDAMMSQTAPVQPQFTGTLIIKREEILKVEDRTTYYNWKVDLGEFSGHSGWLLSNGKIKFFSLSITDLLPMDKKDAFIELLNSTLNSQKQIKNNLRFIFQRLHELNDAIHPMTKESISLSIDIHYDKARTENNENQEVKIYFSFTLTQIAKKLEHTASVVPTTDSTLRGMEVEAKANKTPEQYWINFPHNSSGNALPDAFGASSRSASFLLRQLGEPPLTASTIEAFMPRSGNSK